MGFGSFNFCCACSAPGPWDWVHSPALPDFIVSLVTDPVWRNGPYLLGMGRTVIPPQNDPGYEDYSIANDPIPFEVDLREGETQNDDQFGSCVRMTIAPHAFAERWYYLIGGEAVDNQVPGGLIPDGTRETEIGLIDSPLVNSANQALGLNVQYLTKPHQLYDAAWTQGADAAWETSPRKLKSNKTADPDTDDWVTELWVEDTASIPADDSYVPDIYRLTIVAEKGELEKLRVLLTLVADGGSPIVKEAMLNLNSRSIIYTDGFADANGTSGYAMGLSGVRPGEGLAWVYDLYFSVSSTTTSLSATLRLQLGFSGYEIGTGDPLWEDVQTGQGAYLRSARLIGVHKQRYVEGYGDVPAAVNSEFALAQVDPVAKTALLRHPGTDDIISGVSFAETRLFGGYVPGTADCDTYDPVPSHCVPGSGVEIPPLDMQIFLGYFGHTPSWTTTIPSGAIWSSRWLIGTDAVPITMPWRSQADFGDALPWIVDYNPLYYCCYCGSGGIAWITPVAQVSYSPSGTKTVLAGNGGNLLGAGYEAAGFATWESPVSWVQRWPPGTNPGRGPALENEYERMRPFPRIVYAAPHGYPQVWGAKAEHYPLMVSLDRDITPEELEDYHCRFYDTGTDWVDDYGWDGFVGTYEVFTEQQRTSTSKVSITLGAPQTRKNVLIPLEVGVVDNPWPEGAKAFYDYEGIDPIPLHSPWDTTDDHDIFCGSDRPFFSREQEATRTLVATVIGEDVAWLDDPGTPSETAVNAPQVSRRCISVGNPNCFVDLVEADNWGQSAAAILVYCRISATHQYVNPDWDVVVSSNNNDRLVSKGGIGHASGLPVSQPENHYYDTFDVERRLIVKLGAAIVEERLIYGSQQAAVKYNTSLGSSALLFTGIGVIANDLYVYFERMFDPSDPPRRTSRIDPSPPEDPQTRPTYYNDNPGLYSAGTPIGWRMHVRNASGSTHWTVDSNFDPSALPRFITSSQHHFYVLNFPLCDYRFGGSGICRRWVFQHDGPEYAWPWMLLGEDGAALDQRNLHEQMFSQIWTDSVKQNSQLPGIAIDQDQYPPRSTNSFLELISPTWSGGWTEESSANVVSNKLQAAADVTASPDVSVYFNLPPLWATRRYRLQVDAKAVEKRWLKASLELYSAGLLVDSIDSWLDAQDGAFGTVHPQLANLSVVPLPGGFFRFTWTIKDINVGTLLRLTVVDNDSGVVLTALSGEGVEISAVSFDSNCSDFGVDKFPYLSLGARMVRQSLGIAVLGDDFTQHRLPTDFVDEAEQSVGELLIVRSTFNPSWSPLS